MLRLLGRLDTDGTSGSVAMAGGHAFVADGSGGLKVVDVSVPSAPKLAASLAASGYARSVSVSGRRLGLGCLYDGGFQILDISDPVAPAVLSTNKYTMYNEGWRVVLDGDAAIVVDYFSGIFFAGTISQGSKGLQRHGQPSNSGAVHGHHQWLVGKGDHRLRLLLHQLQGHIYLVI